jgi:hypothetical protein
VVGGVIAWSPKPARAQCSADHLAQCSIDLFQGPVLAPSRVTGLGGAFAAYAEGVDAIDSNAAAVAVRAPYSLEWFDFDLSVGLSFPAAFRRTDFDNDGAVGFTYNDFLFYTLGAQLELGPWGIGVLGDFQRYDVVSATSGLNLGGTETLGRLHALVGRSFFGGRLSIGAGARIVTLSIDTNQNGQSTNQLTMDGIGPEVGVLVRPDYEPWRLGATLRAGVTGHASSGTTSDPAAPAAFVQPASVSLPWELELGAAIQVGPRPLNPHWLDPEDEERRVRTQIDEDRSLRLAAQQAEVAGIADQGRKAERKEELAYQERFIRRQEDEQMDRARDALLLERKARYTNWPRERITVLLALLISGKADQAMGLESFFAQQSGVTGAFKRSGDKISYSPRLGLEGEPVPDRLQTRIGTYIEPSRFDRIARQHFTFGFDVKLFAWNMFGIAGDQIWRIGGVTDVAPRYQNFGLSIGAWH